MVTSKDCVESFVGMDDGSHRRVLRATSTSVSWNRPLRAGHD
jgi:hypothetical protein